MSEIYFVNEEAQKNIEELRKLMINTFRERVPGMMSNWYNSPQIFFGEFGESDRRLGYFSGRDNVIVMSHVLLDPALEKERDAVFLHELAHYVVYSRYCNADPHGMIFKDVCKEIGVPEEFARAESRIQDWAERKAKAENKVKKLLALATSPFEEEADSALSKANRMMEEYSLDYLSKEDNRLFGVDGEDHKRMDAWRGVLYQVISEMTGCFPIFQRGVDGSLHISFFGSREQVESALYLKLYFEDALEKEYRKNKNRLYGSREKNSFLHGLTLSLLKKVRAERQDKALVLSKQKSEDRYKELTSGRIKKRYSYASQGRGFSVGATAGKGMSLPSSQTACKVRRIGYNG